MIATIVATSGLLFGFDTGIISGAIPFFQRAFDIGDNWIELITNAWLVGAAIGAIWSGASSSALMLALARFFLGIAIWVSSLAVPLYCGNIFNKNQGNYSIIVVLPDENMTTGIVEISLTSNDPTPVVGKVTHDHPFLFFIQESSTGTVLFIGRVSDPTLG